MSDLLQALNSDTVVSWASHAMSIGGVWLASEAALKRYIAISACTPPEVVEKSEDVTKEAPKKGWRRVCNKKVAGAVIPPLVFFAFQMTIVFILPKYGPTWVQDLFWSSFLFLGLSIFYDATGRVLFPIPSSVKFIRLDRPQPFSIKQSYAAKYPHRPVIGCALSAMTVFTVSRGINVMKPLAAGAWIVASVTGMGFPRFTIKHTVGFLNAYIIGVPTLGFVVGFLVDAAIKLFGSGDSDSSSNKPTGEKPSDWIISLLVISMSLIPTLLPSLIITLTYRYDFSRTHTTLMLPPSAPGEPVPVPMSTPAFAKPTSRAAVLGLGVTIAGAKIASSSLWPIFANGQFDGAFVLLTIPLISIAVALAAWKMGELQTWWSYEERWVPKAPEPTVAPAADDVEAAGESEDETEKLLKFAEDDNKDEKKQVDLSEL